MLLTMKTVLLILISTMRRRCDVLQMCRDNIFYLPNCMLFPLEVYPKTYSLANCIEDLRVVTLCTFPQNPNLCLVRAVQQYIKKTSLLTTLRKLFVITQSPFSAASDMTMRWWTLRALSEAGIDLDNYTASLTRHASSSKAYFKGVSVQSVMRRARWVNISTFVMHYNLPIAMEKNQKIKHPKKEVLRINPQNSASTSVLMSCAKAKQDAKNTAACHLLLQAQRNRTVKNLKFTSTPFASPPPKVKKTSLPQKIHVEIPAKVVHGTTKQVKVSTRPHIVYTDVLPCSSQSVSDSQVHVPNDDSSTE